VKNKAFILDFNLLKEQNIKSKDFLLLIHLSRNEVGSDFIEDFEILQADGFVKIDNEYNITLREKANLLLELCEIDNVSSTTNKKSIKKSSRAINLELDDFIKEFRMLWKGKKPGSMGSESACRDKMFKWMSENPSYSKDDILKAAKIYLDDLNNLTYLQRADYFIYKTEHGVTDSRLSAFIDEIDSKPVSDWTSQIL